jgi:hypothetical protein
MMVGDVNWVSEFWGSAIRYEKSEGRATSAGGIGIRGPKTGGGRSGRLEITDAFWGGVSGVIEGKNGLM